MIENVKIYVAIVQYRDPVFRIQNLNENRYQSKQKCFTKTKPNPKWGGKDETEIIKTNFKTWLDRHPLSADKGALFRLGLKREKVRSIQSMDENRAVNKPLKGQKQ